MKNNLLHIEIEPIELATVQQLLLAHNPEKSEPEESEHENSQPYFDYFLIDSTRFGGLEPTLERFNIQPETYINLYQDFSEQLQEQGAILWFIPRDQFEYKATAIEQLIQEACFSYIRSDLLPADLVPELESLMEVIQPDGAHVLFRYQDNYAFHVTMQALSALQYRQILSYQFDAWYWQDVERKLYRLQNVESKYRGPRQILTFTQKQFNQIGQGLKPFKIMPLLKTYDDELFQYDDAFMYAYTTKRISRAEQHGLTSFEDQSLYSMLDHQFGEDFAQTGPFYQALQQTKIQKISFQQATDEIALDELRHWHNAKTAN